MLSHNLYYHLKPFIPRSVQIALRRMVIRRRRKSYEHVWPIDEKAGKPPEGWTGWPDGKQFALVLMHDVDTEKGHEKCLELMQLDEKMGFRSSFNFVPERYHVSPDVRHVLVEKGFEVAVHGLRHDGMLFSSRKRFELGAARINQYLKDWQSVGFVSPSMHRNLEWIHDLNVQYDASTFDTDPFEPQPQGVGTIFPFWVPSNNSKSPSNPTDSSNSQFVTRNDPLSQNLTLNTLHSTLSTDSAPLQPSPSNLQPPTFSKHGYVELPYTLPQDFTLFVILGERNINIWKKKLDWIAEHGGMALLITHPDYMNSDHAHSNLEKYPTRYYEELLSYIKEKYEGQYWNALPKEVATFWRDRSSAKIRPPKLLRRGLHVGMLSYSFYENDGRVKRYAETLAARGDRVDVIALKKNGQGPFEIQKGVNVYRIQKRVPDETGSLSYLTKILCFLVHSSIFLSKEHMKHAYDLIHVHSIPDFEIFAGLLPKLTGAKLILDIHDIVPELYTSKFSRNGGSLLFMCLAAMEKASARFSDHVIISNHIWEEKLLSRSVNRDKCTVFLNYPDPAIFFPKTKKRDDNKFIMVYPGTLNWHQGLDLAIGAFSKIKAKVPNAQLHIYGRGSEEQNLKTMIEKLDLKEQVFLKPLIPIEQIADVMTNADLGIVPKRNDPFGGEAFSTKILEFMALGVPVLISATKIDKYYFSDSVVKFFEPENVNALSESMLEMIRNSLLRKTLATNALKFVENFSWKHRKWKYLDLVDRLTNSANHKQ